MREQEIALKEYINDLNIEQSNGPAPELYPETICKMNILSCIKNMKKKDQIRGGRK